MLAQAHIVPNNIRSEWLNLASILKNRPNEEKGQILLTSLQDFIDSQRNYSKFHHFSLFQTFHSLLSVVFRSNDVSHLHKQYEIKHGEYSLLYKENSALLSKLAELNNGIEKCNIIISQHDLKQLQVNKILNELSTKSAHYSAEYTKLLREFMILQEKNQILKHQLINRNTNSKTTYKQLQAKIQYENLCYNHQLQLNQQFLLLERTKLAEYERNQLRTQVEILEAAAQSIQHLIKDLINVEENKVKNSITLTNNTTTYNNNNNNNINPTPSLHNSVTFQQVEQFLVSLNLHDISNNIHEFYPLSKRLTELLIKELWCLKAIEDENLCKIGQKPYRLPEFFQVYMTSRFNDKSKRLKFIREFLLSCYIYKTDHDVELFLSILLGQASELRYLDEMNMLTHLKKSLFLLDLADLQRDGLINKDLFGEGIRKFFPVKTELRLRKLFEIAINYMQSININSREAQIDVSKLLKQDENGDESNFLIAVREQYNEELAEFPIQIRDLLIQNAKLLNIKGPNKKKLYLYAGQIASSISELDPNKPEKEIQNYIKIGLGIHTIQQEEQELEQQNNINIKNNKRNKEEKQINEMEKQHELYYKEHEDSHSYNPDILVELESFLTRFSRLFVHRTYHYRVDLDETFDIESVKNNETHVHSTGIKGNQNMETMKVFVTNTMNNNVTTTTRTNRNNDKYTSNEYDSDDDLN